MLVGMTTSLCFVFRTGFSVSVSFITKHLIILHKQHIKDCLTLQRSHQAHSQWSNKEMTQRPRASLIDCFRLILKYWYLFTLFVVVPLTREVILSRARRDAECLSSKYRWVIEPPRLNMSLWSESVLLTGFGVPKCETLNKRKKKETNLRCWWQTAAIRHFPSVSSKTRSDVKT